MKRRILPFVLLAIVLPISPVSAAHFQMRSLGAIQGTILPSPGELAVPTEITVTLTSRQRDFQAVTSSNGTFEFVGLQSGDYRLRVDCKGYTFNEIAVVVAGSARGEVVTISIPLGEALSKTQGFPTAGQQQTVSKEWLAVPPKAVEQMKKAQAASLKGDHAAAVSHLERAIQHYPDFSQAYNNLAVQYLELDQLENARAALEKAIQVNPEDALAYANRGLVQLREGRIGEALQSVLHARELNPQALGSHGYLGEIYTRMGQHSLAAASFRRAWEIDPTNPEWLLKMANCYLSLGRSAEAVTLLRAFVGRSARDARLAEIRDLITRLDASPDSQPRQQ